MKSVFLLTSLVLQMVNTNPFEGKKYIQVQGGFQGDSMVFIEKNDSLHDFGIYSVFTFSNLGKVKHQLYNPKNIGMCGNGMFYLDTTTFSLYENRITIEGKGGHLVMDKFEFKNEYSWKIDGSKLILTKLRTHYFKKKSEYLDIE